MRMETYVTIGLAAVGMFASWAIWVTVMVFELKAKIALLRQEIEVLEEVKDVLVSIKDSLHKRRL